MVHRSASVFGLGYRQKMDRLQVGSGMGRALAVIVET